MLDRAHCALYQLRMDLRERLRDAMEAKELTYGNLQARSGVDCTPSSLCRKLRGLQVLMLSEAIPLARELDVTIPDVARCRALERALGANFTWPAKRRTRA